MGLQMISGLQGMESVANILERTPVGFGTDKVVSQSLVLGCAEGLRHGLCFSAEMILSCLQKCPLFGPNFGAKVPGFRT